MKKYGSNLFSFWHLTVVLGGLLSIAFGGFYFVNVSAQTDTKDAVETPAEQNLVNGRLAYSVRMAPIPEGYVVTSNPDGSGGTTLPIPTSMTPFQPAWSPDGIKLLFVSPQTTWDIYVINADGSGQANLTNTPSDIRESNPSWSVTGKIAYERTQASITQIWTMNADGSGQTQFPGIMQGAGPAWSPDGTKLAFAISGEIWVINADGANLQRVTNTASTDADPAWSPDGAKIVFGKGGSGISVINADGMNEVPLTSDSNDITPHWSPDGTKIAFRRGNGVRGIYTMDANGANQVRILADSSNFPNCCDAIPEHPAWQPTAGVPNGFIISGRVTYNNQSLSGVIVNLSGTTNAATTTDASGNYSFSGLSAGGNYTVSPSFPRHYFTPPNRSFNNLSSNQLGNNFEVLAVCFGGKCVKNGTVIAFVRSGEIVTINTDGSGQTNITNNAATDGEPDWSPDGSNIIFYSARDGNNEIYRMNANGSNPVNLSNNSASDNGPNYSPDGGSIVFVSHRDGNGEIYKMNADGSNQVRLTNNSTTESSPAFSPDGQKIIFISFASPASLWTMNADGSNQQQVPLDPGSPFQGYGRPSYSPDGFKIMFTYTQDVQSFIRNTWTANSNGTNRAALPNAGRSGAFSPDGRKAATTCCEFDFTNRLRTLNIDGTSVQTFPAATASADYPAWQPQLIPRRTAFDFDGDGKSDISVFRGSNGAWYILQSRAGLWVPVWGLQDDVLVPADYDGDLKTDVAIWRPSDGNFYVLNSFNSTVRVENFGLMGDVPTGGDFDGDGKAEVAVYRGGAQGIFYYRGSMGNPQSNITFIPWGITDDKPVAGDYDGDGRTDAAVFRPSNGVWYVRRSSDAGLTALDWGVATDKLVPADYDGDGKTDFAVFRDGVWYLWRTAQGVTAFQFGISGDVPAPADYDGDGKADVTIYRNGAWWILKSQSGQAEAIQFGIGSDNPVPSVYIR